MSIVEIGAKQTKAPIEAEFHLETNVENKELIITLKFKTQAQTKRAKQFLISSMAGYYFDLQPQIK